MMFHRACPNEAVRKAAQSVGEDFEKGGGMLNYQVICKASCLALERIKAFLVKEI